jgi:hypothetical protein
MQEWKSVQAQERSVLALQPHARHLQPCHDTQQGTGPRPNSHTRPYRRARERLTTRMLCFWAMSRSRTRLAMLSCTASGCCCCCCCSWAWDCVCPWGGLGAHLEGVIDACCCCCCCAVSEGTWRRTGDGSWTSCGSGSGMPVERVRAAGAPLPLCVAVEGGEGDAVLRMTEANCTKSGSAKVKRLSMRTSRG